MKVVKLENNGNLKGLENWDLKNAKAFQYALKHAIEWGLQDVLVRDVKEYLRRRPVCYLQ